MCVDFRPIKDSDFGFVQQVYNYYVINSTATFHTKEVSEGEMKKALPYNHSLYTTYIILYNNEPCGYCYLANWKPRQAYNCSAEVTLYIQPEYQIKGIGSKTLLFLESVAKERGIRNLLGVITAENSGSVTLFSKLKYQKVGHLKKIGEKFGRFLDVLTYQKEI